MKNLKKRELGKILALLTIYIWMTLGITNALESTNPFWISGGFYPGSPTYTIWAEGSNYFAKTGFGQIPTWGYGNVNFSYVFQQCVNSELDHVSIYLKSGIYTATRKITINKHIHVYGDGLSAYLTRINLANNFPDDCLFEIAPLPGGGFFQLPIFERMMIDGKKDQQTHQVNCFNQLNQSAVDLQFYDVWFDSFKGHAINLTCFGQHRIFNCWFEHFTAGYEAIISDETTIWNCPQYVSVAHCHFFETAGFKNYGNAEAVAWEFSDNTFAGGSVTGINLTRTLWFQVLGNKFIQLNTGIYISESSTKSGIIADNLMATGNTDIGGSSNSTYPCLVHDNRGFETENWGSGIILNGQTSETRPHGLKEAPQMVVVTPIDQCVALRVSSVNAVNFTVVREGSSGDLWYYWYAWFRP